MTSYALAHLRNVRMGPPIAEYLDKIDATLTPFGGRFVIHGGGKEVVEGSWLGDVVMISFPDRDHIHAWYASPAYQAILPLRTENSEGDVVIVDGVDGDHRAIDILNTRSAVRAAGSPGGAKPTRND